MEKGHLPIVNKAGTGVYIRDSQEYETYMSFLNEIKAAKEHFLKTGNILPIVRESIAVSWKTCVRNGMDVNNTSPRNVLSLYDFRELCRENQLLIQVATAVFDTIATSIRGADFDLQICDKSGHLLYFRRVSSGRADYNPEQFTFPLGYCALDDAAFDGSVNLAITYQQDFSVHGPEHFFHAFEEQNCDAVLVRGIDDQLIGVVNVFYPTKFINTFLPGVSSMAAHMISQQLRIRTMNNLLDHLMDDVTDGTIVTDSNLRIIKTNRSMLNILKKENILYSDIRDIFPSRRLDSFLKDKKTHLSLQDVTVTSSNSHVRLSMEVTAQYIDNSFNGLFIICRSISEAIKFAQKYTAQRQITFSDIVTQDQRMQGLIEDCKRIAPKNVPVLLEGPSGTGKELFAQSIHSASPRKDKPFIAVNCAALPINLIESELFGYERGAFTGALSSGSAGKFEQADGGTIFLDEVGELPLDMQAKLLRVLDNNRVTRIGGTHEKVLDIRIIAASNRNLQEEVTKKNFRADLFYRLNVMKFLLPSLQERSGDIPLLVYYFLGKLNHGNNVSVRISDQAMQLLQAWPWTGNVRELQNVLTRAFYLCENHVITIDELPDSMLCISPSSGNTSVEGNLDHSAGLQDNDLSPTSIREAERKMIVDALNRCGGNVRQVAAELDIPLSTLYRKLKKFGISRATIEYN